MSGHLPRLGITLQVFYLTSKHLFPPLSHLHSKFCFIRIFATLSKFPYHLFTASLEPRLFFPRNSEIGCNHYSPFPQARYFNSLCTTRVLHLAKHATKPRTFYLFNRKYQIEIPSFLASQKAGKHLLTFGVTYDTMLVHQTWRILQVRTRRQIQQACFSRQPSRRFSSRNKFSYKKIAHFSNQL